MSNRQIAINAVSRKKAMQNPMKAFLGDLLVSIKLDSPTVEGYSKKQAIELTSGLHTKESKNIAYNDLPNDAMLAYLVTLISPIVYTSHKHESMARQNGRKQAHEETIIIYANNSALEIADNRTEFLGEKIDVKGLGDIVGLFWSTIDKEKSQEKWRKNGGSYQKYVGRDKNNKPIWKDCTVTPKTESPKTDNGTTEENLTPSLPSSYVGDVSIAWNQAYQENKNRAKKAKQALAKQAMTV